MVREEVHIGEEVRIIPTWAWVLAGAIFIGIELLFNIYIPHQKNPPPPFFGPVFGTVAAIAGAFYVLLIGYVNRDSKRRSMKTWAWMLVVIFIPNGIGFIIYFLVRQRLMMACPQCGTSVEPGFNFCPKCHFNLTPTCPHCSHSVRHGDLFCPYCGQELKSPATMPVRT